MQIYKSSKWCILSWLCVCSLLCNVLEISWFPVCWFLSICLSGSRFCLLLCCLPRSIAGGVYYVCWFPVGYCYPLSLFLHSCCPLSLLVLCWSVGWFGLWVRIDLLLPGRLVFLFNQYLFLYLCIYRFYFVYLLLGF